MYFLGILLYMRNIIFKLEREDWVEGGSFSVLIHRKMSQILFDKIVFHFFGKGLLQF